MRKILVALDGLESNSKALEKSIELQNLYEAELLLYMNLNESGTNFLKNFKAEDMEETSENHSHWHDEMCSLFPYPDKVRTIVDTGEIGPRIVAYAELEEVDLIVLGSRGLNGLQSLLLGSISKYVAVHAPCSVYIVK